MADIAASVASIGDSAKFVVFSACPLALGAVARELDRTGMRHVTISGHVSAAARSTAVCDFNSDPQIRVALLTTGSAAAGLTLTAAQTVYLLEPAFSTVDEAQALSRAHRIGQTHTVRCVILYSKRTLEERLLKLRQELGTLGAFLSGQGAISGVTEGNTEISHLLSIENMTRLFGEAPAGADAAAGNANGNAAAAHAGGFDSDFDEDADY
eukprot:8905-Heterococcus_DN1.PRE.1